MNKYDVTIRRNVYETYEVEADDLEKAKQRILNYCDNPKVYITQIDQGEVIDIRELLK